MNCVKLNNGIDMPVVGIGTFMQNPDQAEESVYNALKNGYRLIDTANAYVNEKGVGRGIKKSGVKREEIFLETKLWPALYEEEDQIDKTLERLDTNYIDLLLLHQPCGNYIKGYQIMEKAVKEGKVRAIGLSNFSKEQVEEILNICEIKPTVLQVEAHPYYPENELKEFLVKHDIKIQAWYPLGHGDKNLINELIFKELAEKYGKSNVQIILKWHIQSGNIVIPGATNPEHIKANIDLFDFELSEDDMKEIAKVNKNVRYYESSPEKLASYAGYRPDLDAQK